MIALGLDLGSSSIKGAAIDVESGAVLASGSMPEHEMTISAPRPGWAEQNPDDWWNTIVLLTRKLLQDAPFSANDVAAIGISYQMHGLVVVDAAGKPLRPSIIWCDSRAVEIGNRAFTQLGEKYCLESLLNSPGNFTASKLRWVIENEPEVAKAIRSVMLPGDYVAFRMTGERTTTATGLSEGIFWDFAADSIAEPVLSAYGIDRALLPTIVPTVGLQGKLTSAAAEELGVAAGTPIAYRAGDQPNNALSLGVLEPGEIAATAGTSGVVYGVTGGRAVDPSSRVNTFLHVNHTTEHPRLGVLLCINGTGIMNSWVKKTLSGSISYDEMNAEASRIPVGSDGLTILPFGNGAERMLENRTVGGRIVGLDLNRHSRGHVIRAAQEGVAFAFRYGIGILRSLGIPCTIIRAPHDNMFRSVVFRSTVAQAADAAITLVKTSGAEGAARAASVGAGLRSSLAEACASLQVVEGIHPDRTSAAPTEEAYHRWAAELERAIKNH